MADGAVNQLQARLDGALADVLDIGAFVNALNLGVSAELEVDLVGVVDEFLGKILADQVGQFAADLVGQGQLAVRECTCTRKSRCDMAVGLTVNTVLCFCLSTASFFYRSTLFDYQNFFV